MSNKENVKIISARPEDADFIAWIVAQSGSNKHEGDGKGNGHSQQAVGWKG